MSIDITCAKSKLVHTHCLHVHVQSFAIQMTCLYTKTSHSARLRAKVSQYNVAPHYLISVLNNPFIVIPSHVSRQLDHLGFLGHIGLKTSSCVDHLIKTSQISIHSGAHQALDSPMSILDHLQHLFFHTRSITSVFPY